MVATVEILNPTSSDQDRSGSAAALVLFGLPPTAVGGWLIWSLRQQHGRSLEDLADPTPLGAKGQPDPASVRHGDPDVIRRGQNLSRQKS